MSTRLVTVTQGQSIMDIAIQEYGTVLGSEQLVKDNPNVISTVTDNLVAGDRLVIDEGIAFPISEAIEELLANDEFKTVSGVQVSRRTTLVFDFDTTSADTTGDINISNNLGSYSISNARLTNIASYDVYVNGNLQGNYFTLAQGDVLRINFTRNSISSDSKIVFEP